MDVDAPIARLPALSVRVYCLQPGGADPTSPAGQMTMCVISAMSQFERDLLMERTQAERIHPAKTALRD